MDLLYATPSVTSFLSYLAYMNTITGNLFWTLVSITILITLFISFSVFRFKQAAIASLFIAFVLTVLLRMGGLVSDVLVGLYIIVLAFAALYAKFSSSDE